MQSDRLNTVSVSDASISRNSAVLEQANAEGVYTAKCVGPVESERARYVQLRDQIAAIINAPIPEDLLKEFEAIPMEEKWSDCYQNTVTTVGKNDLLDKYLAGSSYTAAFYLGLISSTSYSAINAADTMSSHAGWLEAGAANTPTYSQGARPTAAWSAASSGSKALSSALAYSITGTGTIKGSFLTTVATKDGTTGILFSAGLFSGGDRAVINGDTVNVSYSLAV